MKRQTSIVVTSLILTSCLSACGGGGGGGDSPGAGGGGNPSPETVTFAGGKLDDLKALSPTLTFRHLVISGSLELPVSSNTTLTAEKLTITPTGKIGYTYTTCQYVDAPALALNASGAVLIEGEIRLHGRSGTTVTESATCNRCTGQDGGSITIRGSTIAVRGKLWNYGGGGASTHWSFGGSSPCSAGGSGKLTIAAATSMDLSGAEVNNTAGRNFENSAGPSGTAEITAGGTFTMINGALNSTGAMTFRAASTNILGSISYGSLNETIGGLPDNTGPVLSVISPPDNAEIVWHQPLEIKLNATDAGMGLRSVKITGLGHDATHSLAAFDAQGAGTVTISLPEEPATLTVTATDQAGNTTTASVTGLQFRYPAEAEPNDNLVQAQTLAKGGKLQGDIANGDAGTASGISGIFQNNAGQARIEDFYKATCCKVVTCGSWPNEHTCYSMPIRLNFAQGAALRPDLDLYLLNAAGAVVAKSTIDNQQASSYSEALTANFTFSDVGKTYYIGIQAWDVPSRVSYILGYEDAP